MTSHVLLGAFFFLLCTSLVMVEANVIALRENFVFVQYSRSSDLYTIRDSPGSLGNYILNFTTNTMQLVGPVTVAVSSDPGGVGILDTDGVYYYFVYLNAICKTKMRLKAIESFIVVAGAFNQEGYTDGTLANARFKTVKGLHGPRDLSFIVVVSQQGMSIRKIDFVTGMVTTLFYGYEAIRTSGGSKFSIKYYAVDVAPSGQFMIFLTDNWAFETNNHRLTLYNFTSNTTTFLTSASPGSQDGFGLSVQVQDVKAVAISAWDEHVYFTQQWGSAFQIRRYTLKSGECKTLYQNETNKRPFAMAMGRTRGILVVSYESPAVVTIYQDTGESLVILAEYSGISGYPVTLSMWSKHVPALAGFDVSTDYRRFDPCPTGSYGAGDDNCRLCEVYSYNPTPAAGSCMPCSDANSTGMTVCSSTQAMLTTTAVPPTTTVASTTTPSQNLPLQAVRALTRVDLFLGEACLESYQGFQDARTYCCPFLSDTFGCNGTSWYEVGWSGRIYDYGACPWKLNEGCMAKAISGFECGPGFYSCFRDCESGCVNKTKCDNLTTNAVYTGYGTNSSNCPWDCVSGFVKVNGRCALANNTEIVTHPNPNATLRCTTFEQCWHCPRAARYGREYENLWGCSNYDVRLHNINSNTYTPQALNSVDQLALGYCAYWRTQQISASEDGTYSSSMMVPEYCPDPAYVANVTYATRCSGLSECGHCPKTSPFDNVANRHVYGCHSNNITKIEDNVIFEDSYGNPYTPILNVNSLPNYQYLLREFNENVCIYYDNRMPRRCPDPVLAIPSLQTTSSNALGKNFTPTLRCSKYSDCSFCPSYFQGYTSGCVGSSFVTASYVVFTNYTPGGLMTGYCAFYSSKWMYCPEPMTTTTPASTTPALPQECWSPSECPFCPEDSSRICSKNQCFFRGVVAWERCPVSAQTTTRVISGSSLSTSSGVPQTTSYGTNNEVSYQTTSVLQGENMYWVRFKLLLNKAQSLSLPYEFDEDYKNLYKTLYDQAVYTYERHVQALNMTLNVDARTIMYEPEADPFKLSVAISHYSLEQQTNTIERLIQWGTGKSLQAMFEDMNLYWMYWSDPEDTFYVESTEPWGVFINQIARREVPVESNIPCTNYNPCNRCPYGYSRGCSGRYLWIANRPNFPYVVNNVIAPGTNPDYCVFYNEAQWMYCPEDSETAMRLVWQLIFYIIVNKMALTSQDVDLYVLATSIVLQIDRQQITAGVFRNNVLQRRRLLQATSRLDMIIDLNQSQDVAYISEFVRNGNFQSNLDNEIQRLNLASASAENMQIIRLAGQNNNETYGETFAKKESAMKTKDYSQYDWLNISGIVIAGISAGSMFGLTLFTAIWPYFKKNTQNAFLLPRGRPNYRPHYRHLKH